MAFSPEFNSDNLEKFGYDPNWKVKFRNRSSLSGQRNPREALILGIQNVPNGYQLVKKVDDKYIVFGATDEFGTFTIINIPPLPFDTEQTK